MLPLNDTRIYHERDSSGRPLVFLSSSGMTWNSWSKTAQDLRRRSGEVECGIVGRIYVGKPPLRAEPQYLAQEHLPHTWRPMINITVTDEATWTKAVQAAQEACMRTESEYHRTGQLPTTDLYHIGGPRSGETIDREAWKPKEDNLVTALLRRLNGEEKTERNTSATRPAWTPRKYEPTYPPLTKSRPAGKIINTGSDSSGGDR